MFIMSDPRIETHHDTYKCPIELSAILPMVGRATYVYCIAYTVCCIRSCRLLGEVR